MEHKIYLNTFTSIIEYQDSLKVFMPLESFIAYCIFKYCTPQEIELNLVPKNNLKNEISLCVADDTLMYVKKIPWQVSSCLYPVVMFDDTIITGLCAVARHVTKYRSGPKSCKEHEDGLLGFRKSCLQAPNEVSIWTKFCEVDIVRSVKEILSVDVLKEMPKNLVRFENHLSKPVRVHNVYKIARDLKKEDVKISSDNFNSNDIEINTDKPEKQRVAKPRKWKSNTKAEQQIDASTKFEDLNVSHQFAEGPFLTLADLVLLPSYSLIMEVMGSSIFESLLPLTMKWFSNLKNIPELNILHKTVYKMTNKNVVTDNIILPITEGVSLYKCDPTRHNPKKRLFTKEDDIENALSTLLDGMKLDVSTNNYDHKINWQSVPDGANPAAGHLPDTRINRKSEQLENLALAVLRIAKDGNRIVDFCSGSGHLGILIAHLLPKCTVILLENKEQSLLRARKRVHGMNLNNVFFFQCNLDFFVGEFDIGIALHACGIASDLVLDKCLRARAKFVICPCCYGSLHSTDRMVYPRSEKFSNMNTYQYMCIGHAADQTHEEHPLTVRGDLCMAVIDSDRARLAEECGYKVTLSRLKPLTCTPKNNLLVGIPS